MKKNILFCLFILIACNHVKKNHATADLQQLSSILSTANWQVTDGIDTSYIYFSRQFDNSYKIYEFKLFEGDSSVTYQGSIKEFDDSVVWDWNNQLLSLEELTDSKANWKAKVSNENYVLQKINDSSLALRFANKQLILRRTLPLSTFLVRAKYDHEQRTNLLDSAEIPPKKLIKNK